MSMANNGFNLSVEIPGLAEFVDNLELMETSFYDNLEEGVKEYGSLLEEGGQALAPYDGGELETSIQFKDFRHVGNRMEGAVGSDLKYALRRHEDPYKEGTRDKYDAGVKFEEYYTDGRGQETILRPGWRGQKAGRKYLERAVDASETDFNEIMGEVYEKTFRGRGR